MRKCTLTSDVVLKKIVVSETHLRQSEVQQHSLIHLQHMDFEDKFVVAFVQCANCHLKGRMRFRVKRFIQLVLFFPLSYILFWQKCGCTCLLQVSLKPSAKQSQASLRAVKEASAFTVVKKRVNRRTNLCHGVYRQKVTCQDSPKTPYRINALMWYCKGPIGRI